MICFIDDDWWCKNIETEKLLINKVITSYFPVLERPQITDLLIAVVRVDVLQRGGHQVGRDIPVDEGERLPRLQVAVRRGPILVVTVAAALRPRSPGLLLGDAPLDGGQRLGDEGAEAVRSGRYKQLCHLVILLLQRAARGSAGARSCNRHENRNVTAQASGNSWAQFSDSCEKTRNKLGSRRENLSYCHTDGIILNITEVMTLKSASEAQRMMGTHELTTPAALLEHFASFTTSTMTSRHIPPQNWRYVPTKYNFWTARCSRAAWLLPSFKTKGGSISINGRGENMFWRSQGQPSRLTLNISSPYNLLHDTSMRKCHGEVFSCKWSWFTKNEVSLTPLHNQRLMMTRFWGGARGGCAASRPALSWFTGMRK